MDENRYQQNWGSLETAIKEIQLKCKTNDMSYVELYRNAYDIVVNKRSNKLYSNLRSAVVLHLQTNVRENVLKSINNVFLQTLNKEWIDHQLSMVMIRDILMYMDKVYVQQNDVDNIYNLGISLFKENVARFPAIKEKLRQNLLELINKEREGEVVDRSSIKIACEMLCLLGINKIDVYQDDFEKSFLGETEEFYKVKQQKCMAENSISSYLKMTKKWIDEEVERAKHYLHETTEPKVYRLVEKLLVKDQMQQIIEMGSREVSNMITCYKFDDLSLLFSLFKKHDGGEDIVYKCFSACLHEQGEKIYQEDKVEGTPNAALTMTALNIIQKLFELKSIFTSLTETVFQGDVLYVDRFNSEFKLLMRNKNNTPEYMSLFLDKLLRKGDKNFSDDEIDYKMETFMDLFKCLADKVLFEEYYRKHLSNRLIGDKSLSHDLEKNMVAKLKLYSGWEFTYDIEAMFKDITFSEDWIAKYKEHIAQAQVAPPIDLNVKLLKDEKWSIPNENANCLMPPVAIDQFNNFVLFYTKSHKDRKLLLNPGYGTAELKFSLINPTTKAVKHHIVNVSTMCMVVLLLFNEHKEMTFEAIQYATNIKDLTLKKHLATLIWGKNSTKVLLKKPDDRVKKIIQSTDVFCINEEFNSKAYKVNIPTPENKRETVVEKTDTNNQVEKRRAYEINACIVRVMKMRKQLTHIKLVMEVTEQLRNRFLVDPQKIKVGISELLEKEYLIRSAESNDIYVYVA